MIDYVSIPEERMKVLGANKTGIKTLEEFTKVKITFDGEVCIEGEDPLILLRVKEVIKAFGRGFDLKSSMNLLDEDYSLEVISIQDYSGKSRNRQTVLKGRVIGTEGKAKETIEKDCAVKISIYGKTISILGKWEGIGIAKDAIEQILRGSKHTSVFKFLKERKTA